jgi:hypothetical protein
MNHAVLIGADSFLRWWRGLFVLQERPVFSVPTTAKNNGDVISRDGVKLGDIGTFERGFHTTKQRFRQMQMQNG